ncbi:ThuA domain-containing protein [Sinimarinibacterium thermocellulolyticum]|uniref:ThuA domain-containing protein n=1 Tax=Sinimarinibacterium thermocellulolyticum TaxID=3170016 RepID=A0ABV2A9I0_9GAMM
MRKTLVANLMAGALAAPLFAGCGSADAPAASTEAFRVLVFSRTAGFRHASIETGVDTVRTLGAQHGFGVDHTEDPAAFSTENLAQYAVVLWLSTTGDVLDEAQQLAFEQYIGAGGGYAGVHSASDTEYDWPFYGELVGAYFHSHPVFPVNDPQGPGVQSAQLHLEAPDHPAVAHLPVPWTIRDEFYSFRTNPRGQVRVLLNIDEASYAQDPNTTNIAALAELFASASSGFTRLPDPDALLDERLLIGETGTMNDHPMSWCHDRLGGRAWYTALGHSVSIYGDANFRQHLLNGILTAARRVDADCVPREDGPLAERDTGPAFPDLPPQIITGP